VGGGAAVMKCFRLAGALDRVAAGNKGRPPALTAGVVKCANIDYTGDGNFRQMFELYLPTS